MSVIECLNKYIEQRPNARKSLVEILDAKSDDEALRMIHEGLDKAKHEVFLAEQRYVRTVAIDEYLDANTGKMKRAAVSLFSRSPMAGRIKKALPSVERYIDHIVGTSHSKLAKAMEQYRPKNIGFAKDRAGQANMLKAVFGEKVNDQDANMYASLWKEIAEELRERFNRAGGAIPKLKSWNIPQHHNASKLRKVTEDEWVTDVKDMIDQEAMLHYTNRSRDPDETIDTLLRAVFQSVRTEGVNKIDFTKLDISYKGKKAIGNTHQEHRLLHFKNSDAWSNYQKKYGSDTPFDAMLSHIDMMSREIGMMEMLGPNPEMMMKRIQDRVASDAGTRRADHGIEAVYNNIAGKLYSRNTGISDTMNAFRNFQVATKLPFAALSALSDVPFMQMTAAYNKMPIFRLYANFAKNLIGGGKAARKTATELGIMAEFAVDRAAAASRISEVVAQGWVGRWADATIRATGLNHWTISGKQTFQMEMLRNFAGLAKKNQKFSEFTPKMQAHLKGYGVDELKWNKIKEGDYITRKNGIDYIDMTKFGSDIEGRELGGAMSTMLFEETRFAVPEPNAYNRGIINQGLPTGTVAGEMLRTMGQFQSFGISVMTTHMSRLLLQDGVVNKLTYGANLMLGTTMFGALAYNFKEIAKGKTPIDMEAHPVEFWKEAFIQGGMTGPIASLILNAREFGISGAMTGATLSDAEEALKLVMGVPEAAMNAEKKLSEAFGDIGVAALDRMPGRLWQTKLLYDRYFVDQLERATDPDYYENQRRLESRMDTRTGQSSWWKPGSLTPF